MITVDEALFAGKPEEGLRRDAWRILASALEAVDPERAIYRYLRREGDSLVIGEKTYNLRKIRRICIVGAGKATARMAKAMETILGDRIEEGVVVVKRGYTEVLERIQLVEAGHPLPDESGVKGAEAVLGILQKTGEEDLVICLISGGGSALLPAPAEGLTLEDKVRVTDLLLRAGATIQELNTVRKHLSRLKGGQLARAAAPAQVVSLILSDVIGNPLDVIASGPTVPDPTTYEDALRIVERYGLEDKVPPGVLQHLKKGQAGEIPETPKPKDPLFQRVQNLIVGSNELATLAASEEASRLGYRTLILSTFVEGEAREVGKVLGSIGKEILLAGRPLERPACILAGGETTVTVRGQGRGGRNQEVALGAALIIAGLPSLLVASFATDGTDGPTDAAGAFVEGTTIERALALGLDPHRHLANNDAYPFFAALSDLILTGPTNTNVNDLMLVLAGPRS
ncbi:MAG: glycerate kinase [Armatimonadota bacterium]|nr:glycerate kinase [Armatimonadota bacterium]MDR7435852.1 glycerate kinase [Armatimonadota bacterium]